MKVILVQDVDNLGRTGDIKEVSPGYARNYLIRRGLVVPATESQLKQLHVFQSRRQKEDARRLSEAESLGQRLAALHVVIPARVGEQGRLFGSVTTQDIAAALKEQHGIEIDRRDLQLEEPIRTLGTHTVDARLGGQVHAQLRVEVVDENQAATTEKAPAAERAEPAPASA